MIYRYMWPILVATGRVAVATRWFYRRRWRSPDSRSVLIFDALYPAKFCLSGPSSMHSIRLDLPADGYLRWSGAIVRGCPGQPSEIQHKKALLKRWSPCSVGGSTQSFKGYPVHLRLTLSEFEWRFLEFARPPPTSLLSLPGPRPVGWLGEVRQEHGARGEIHPKIRLLGIGTLFTKLATLNCVVAAFSAVALANGMMGPK